MIHVHDAIREHLLRPRNEPHPAFTYLALARSEWSPQFERFMRNRMIAGAFRYGLLHNPYKPAFDRVEYARRKLTRYVETGNLESLVDAANLCLLEFE